MVQQGQFTTLGCGFNCLAGIGAGLGLGCAVGTVFGLAGGPVGAAVGCVAGAVATGVALGIGAYIGAQSSGQVSLGAQYAAWAKTVMAAFGNEENLTATSYANLASALNFSSIGFQRMADNAALLQLNRSSYSYPLDLVQSGLAAQMGAIGWAYTRQVGEVITPTINQLNGNGAPGATYASVNPEISSAGGFGLSGAGSLTYTAGASSSFQNYVGGPMISTASGSAATFDVYVPGGTNITEAAPAGTTLTIAARSYANPLAWWNVTTSIPSGSGLQYATVPTPQSGGSYNFTFTDSGAGAGSSYIMLSSGTRLPSSSNTPLGIDAIGTYFGAGQSSVCGGTAAAQWFWTDPSTFVLAHYATCSVTTADTPSYKIFAGPTGGQNFLTWLGKIEWNAALNGNAYWSFLRSLGYTSASQIPANCIIPAPYQVLPSNLNLGNLTVPQLTSLYEVWLQGLGNFYNVTLSGTQFCGQQNARFNLNSVTWGNWAVSTVGSLYIANSSGTFNYNGKPLGSERFSNASSWAITATQIVLMPTLQQISVPVGTRWAVPTNNPVWVYVYDTVGYCNPQNLTPACQGDTSQILQLTGNGTGTGGCLTNAFFCPAAKLVPLALAPGSSILLTSCTINGAAKANCTIGPQNISVTVRQLTCGSACNQSAPPGAFVFWNPFTALACLIAVLFGGCGNALGSLISSILTFLIVAAVILVLLYLGVSYAIGKGRGLQSTRGAR
ncbi:MAG TPA: hypothetical protein VGV89_01600 [Thermoplasmata archaeon]|nr:hypothetical protein [Thermoplasmata archaeon]